MFGEGIGDDVMVSLMLGLDLFVFMSPEVDVARFRGLVNFIKEVLLYIIREHNGRGD